MLKGTNASATVTVSSDLAYVLELRHSHLESSNLHERDSIIKMIKMVFGFLRRFHEWRVTVVMTIE